MKKVFGILCFILLAALALPRFFGYQPEVVISGSMEPAIPAGALIFIKRADFQDLTVGDVITYRLKAGETRVTHRIIEKNTGSRSFVTKGDANDTADGAAVDYARVEGKVMWSLPRLGRAALLLTTVRGKGALIALLLIVSAFGRLPAHFWQRAGTKTVRRRAV